MHCVLRSSVHWRVCGPRLCCDSSVAWALDRAVRTSRRSEVFPSGSSSIKSAVACCAVLWRTLAQRTINKSALEGRSTQHPTSFNHATSCREVPKSSALGACTRRARPRVSIRIAALVPTRVASLCITSRGGRADLRASRGRLSLSCTGTSPRCAPARGAPVERRINGVFSSERWEAVGRGGALSARAYAQAAASRPRSRTVTDLSPRGAGGAPLSNC